MVSKKAYRITKYRGIGFAFVYRHNTLKGAASSIIAVLLSNDKICVNNLMHLKRLRFFLLERCRFVYRG